MSSTPGPGNAPPGKFGCPFIGHTLSFARDPFHYIATGVDRYGKVFKSRLLFKKTAVIEGAEACHHFIDETKIVREKAYPSSITTLFGGANSLPFLDGSIHRARKQLVLEAFSDDALRTYFPDITRIVEARFDRWSKMEEFAWLPEIKSLTLHIISANLLGLEDANRVDRIEDDIVAVSKGLIALPLPIPGTTYWKALKAKDRLLATYRAIVQQHRRETRNDGVARILRGRADDGTTLTDDTAASEIHHMFIAGFVVFAHLASAVMLLAENSDVLEKLQAEVRTLGRGALDYDAVGRMPYLDCVTMEVKRMSPVIPMVIGRSIAPFELQNSVVPAGWQIMRAVSASNLDPVLFPNPKSFDPNRFADGRIEQLIREEAFTPQGAGPPLGHRCAGLDYSRWMLKVFLVQLARYEWELSPQNLHHNWKLNPPEPIDPIRAKVRPMSANAFAASR